MNRPRFSICIPNYNYGRFLGATIASVLEQPVNDLEVIVSDNASTDNSVEVVEAIGDRRVRLLRSPCNVGFAANLERVTAPARGDFVLVLSADDLMLPGALETYATILDQNEGRALRCVLCAAAQIIDGEGRTRGFLRRRRNSIFFEEATERPTETELQETSGREALRQALLRKDSPAAFLTTMYPRELGVRAGGYWSGYRMAPDGHFLNRLLLQDPYLIYCPQPLFAYRVHDQNQLAQEARGGLKYQLDAYLHTMEFPSEALESLGIERKALEKVFVEKAIAVRGLQALVAGRAMRGFQIACMGLATYPGIAMRQPKYLGLLALLVLGPLSVTASRALYDLRRLWTAAERR